MTKSFRSNDQTDLLLKDLIKWHEEYYNIKINQSQIIEAAIKSYWIELRTKILSNKLDTS